MAANVNPMQVAAQRFDNALDRAEFLDGVRILGIPLTRKELNLTFDKLDKDGGGFSVTASEWISAVPASQGMKLAFSTGSQNHQPPQPSSL